MKKSRSIIILILAAAVFVGCSNADTERTEPDRSMSESQTETENQSAQNADGGETAASDAKDQLVDYSNCFQGLNGCAVLFDESTDTYFYFGKEECEAEVSPLSTFKIVSALAGLENGVLKDEETKMEYSGIQYPVDAWNADLTLKEAFESSCIWYFRQVVDAVGQEEMQTLLDELQYGNCDISQWDGSGVNPLPELNGFWIDSSLKISPLQQVEVMKCIFGTENHFQTENLEKLKNIIYAADLDSGTLYGKTGSGTGGKAWFTGFLEKDGSKTYFAVYLDDLQNKDAVSGSRAREIAVSILD